MYNFLTYVLFFVFPFTCCISTGAAADSVDKTSISDSLQVKKSVKQFYDNYINNMNSGVPENFLLPMLPSHSSPNGSLNAQNISKYNIVEYLKMQKEVAPIFSQKVDKRLRKLVKEYGQNSVFDPILMAQDTPLLLKYSQPEIVRKNAEIIVYKIWNINNPTMENGIKVSLEKSKDVWKIMDIVDSVAK